MEQESYEKCANALEEVLKSVESLLEDIGNISQDRVESMKTNLELIISEVNTARSAEEPEESEESE